jgi:hypothetical protein
LKKRFRDDIEKVIVKMMMKNYRKSTIQAGENEVNGGMGLPQDSVFSLFLFYVYLEEAIRSSQKLEE